MILELRQMLERPCLSLRERAVIKLCAGAARRPAARAPNGGRVVGFTLRVRLLEWGTLVSGEVGIRETLLWQLYGGLNRWLLRGTRPQGS